MRRLVILLVLSATAACGHSPTPAPASPQPGEPAEHADRSPEQASERPEAVDIGVFMPDHFAIASFARDAVVAGDLERVRSPLRQLAEYDYAELAPGRWLPWIARLQTAARLTAEAADLERAAAGVSAMAVACGQCHTDSGRGPELVLPQGVRAEPSEDSLEERMLRHSAAAELMWSALIGPSDPAWSLGADALAAAPSAPPEEMAGSPSFTRALSDLRGLGQRAQVATSVDDRADIFGLLLVGCSRCHSQL